MTSLIKGLHHVTAIAGGARRNLDFYRRTLGLRFVKKTVNFDDPTTYHLYYGDRTGSAGTIMTFFPWEAMDAGVRGLGQVSVTQFAVPPASLDFWAARLEAGGGQVTGRDRRFGEERLLVADPDGLDLALVARSGDDRQPWLGDGLSEATAIRGFHGVTLALPEEAGARAVLEGVLGYRRIAAEEDGGGGRQIRYQAPGDVAAGVVDVALDPGAATGRMGTGTVHHVAFAVADRAAQQEVRTAVQAAGLAVTPVIDRNYFWSIYFRIPGGVLFEVATEEPGFLVDESEADLGRSLKLPEQHEPRRTEIERLLSPLESEAS
jgi:glyoxalase family protein